MKTFPPINTNSTRLETLLACAAVWSATAESETPWTKPETSYHCNCPACEQCRIDCYNCQLLNIWLGKKPVNIDRYISVPCGYRETSPFRQWDREVTKIHRQRSSGEPFNDQLVRALARKVLAAVNAEIAIERRRAGDG